MEESTVEIAKFKMNLDNSIPKCFNNNKNVENVAEKTHTKLVSLFLLLQVIRSLLHMELG